MKARSLIIPSAGPTSASLLEDIAEAASTRSGAESLALELSETTIAELSKALSKVQSGVVSQTVPLSQSQKYRLLLESGIPFIGFGFVDNSGMLIFGDQIDMSLGVTFALSAMASAALGNMLSDVLGISMGSTIAAWSARIGMPSPNLTLEQSMSTSARRWRQFGATLGVVIGCLLGMFPLFFIDSNKTHRLKRSKLFNDLFGAAITFVAEALGAESATLFVVDRAKGQLWTRASKELAKDVRLPLDMGLVGLCVRTALPVNVENAYKHPSFLAALDEQTGSHTKSVLCTPVFDRGGRVIGVLEVINKRTGAFTIDDERSLSAMAAHVAVVLEEALTSDAMMEQNTDSETRLLDQLRACTRHAHHRFDSQRLHAEGDDDDDDDGVVRGPARWWRAWGRWWSR